MMDTSETSSVDSNICGHDSITYWKSISPTVSGMLGGFPQLSRIDLRSSSNFLTKLRRLNDGGTAIVDSPFKRGVDCGAGIGRITAGFLSKVCETVDVVEPVGSFAQKVGSAQMTGKGKVGKVYVKGLEAWVPEEKYDLMWNQWCLGHLKDTQLVEYLKRSKGALVDGGWIVVKENMSTDIGGKDLFDPLDSTVTRTDSKFKKLFESAGLKVVRTELQPGFPKSLYPVRFYALQPADG
ncbi:MAG: hypothetical protein LQ351_000209 [Letrouitia transgressa]|nr:MAG: hypothetical protein LQ351_000209 [Letrouitia transgressa]